MPRGETGGEGVASRLAEAWARVHIQPAEVLAESQALLASGIATDEAGMLHGVALGTLGRLAEAETILRPRLAVGHHGLSRRGVVEAECALAMCEARTERRKEALARYDRLLVDLRALGAVAELAKVQGLRGWLLNEMGRPEESVAALRESLAGALQDGTPGRAAAARGNLAAAVRQQGRLGEALMLSSEALADFQQLGRMRDAANVQLSLGWLAAELRQWDEAENKARWAINGFRTAGFTIEIAGAHHLLGTVAAARAGWGDAPDSFRTVAAIAEQLGDVFMRRMAQAELAACLAHLGWLAEGEKLALAVWQELAAAPPGITAACVAISIAELHRAAGRREGGGLPGAVEALEGALAVTEASAQHRLVRLCLEGLCLLAQEQGDVARFSALRLRLDAQERALQAGLLPAARRA